MTDMKDVVKAEDERLLKEVQDIAGKRQEETADVLCRYMKDMYECTEKDGAIVIKGCGGEKMTMDSFTRDIADAVIRQEDEGGDEYGVPYAVLEYMARNERNRFRQGRSYGDEERRRELISELFGTF